MNGSVSSWREDEISTVSAKVTVVNERATVDENGFAIG